MIGSIHNALVNMAIIFGIPLVLLGLMPYRRGSDSLRSLAWAGGIFFVVVLVVEILTEVV